MASQMLARASHMFAGTAVAGGGIVFMMAQLEGREGSLPLALARIDGKLRPTLAAMLPSEAFVCLYSSSRNPFIKALSMSPPQSQGCATTPAVRVMGLTFRNDLGNAAGLDKDGSLLDFNYALGAGFAVVGTVLSEDHTGNIFSFLGGMFKGNAWTPLPVSGAALNSLGLPSKGVDTALDNIAAFRERHSMRPQDAGQKGGTESDRHFPIGVSIMGHPAHSSDPAQKQQGILDCVRKSLPLADFIEINESCPNVNHGAHGAEATKELAARLQAVVAVRDQVAKKDGRRVPILVKMGDLGDPKATVKFLSKLGVDGVVALNTQKDYDAFDLPVSDRSLLEYYTTRYGGGLSGPPILDRSTAQVASAKAAVKEFRLGGKFTVIHVGGLQNLEDMQRSRATGAELRQWYTGLMHGLAQPEPLSLYARLTASDSLMKPELLPLYA